MGNALSNVHELARTVGPGERVSQFIAGLGQVEIWKQSANLGKQRFPLVNGRLVTLKQLFADAAAVDAGELTTQQRAERDLRAVMEAERLHAAVARASSGVF